MDSASRFLPLRCPRYPQARDWRDRVTAPPHPCPQFAAGDPQHEVKTGGKGKVKTDDLGAGVVSARGGSPPAYGREG